MPYLEGEETLREHWGEMTPEAIHATVLRMTGDKDEADDAMVKRIDQQHRAGEMDN